jgi:hypothetical protein
MQKKSIYFNKILIIGIIFILIGLSVTPIISGNVKNKKTYYPNNAKEIVHNYSQPENLFIIDNDRYPSFGCYPEGCNYVYFYHPPRELEWEYNNEDFNGTIKEFRLLASDNTNHSWNLNKFELHINGINCSIPDTQSFYRRHWVCYDWEIIWNNLDLNCSGEILFEVLYLECTWIEYKGDYNNDGDETFHYSYNNPRSQINGELNGDHIFDSDKVYIVFYLPPIYNPPYAPLKPTGKTSGYICIDHNYSTSATDPNGLNVSYGWDWNGDKVVDEWTDWYESNETCIISHNWSNPKNYKISVRAKNTNEEEGNWSTRLNVTIKNHYPYPPCNPNPPDEEPDVPVNTRLCWTGGDPDICDTVVYDVYFGLSKPPPLQSYHQTETCYDAYNLEFFKTYHWKVVAWDNHGESSEGPLWSFCTGSNQPPTIPDFDIPSRWPVGVELCINLSSSDPEYDKIKYEIDWGDGTIDETNLYVSGRIVEVCHTYKTKGNYVIKIRAIDEYGAMSEWSEAMIEIPRNRAAYTMVFQWLFEQFPLIYRWFCLVK